MGLSSVARSAAGGGPPPGAGRAEAAELQAHLTALSRSLRAEVRKILEHRKRLEPFLPPLEECDALREEHAGSFLLSLYDLAQGLVAEGLSPVIAELDRTAAAKEGARWPPEIDFYEIWRELDPEAPPAEAA